MTARRGDDYWLKTRQKSRGGTGRASPLFIHSFPAELCSAAVDNRAERLSPCGAGEAKAPPAPSLHLLFLSSRASGPGLL
ncbi:hypothetical protein DR73_4459 [Enterobacteriaceae bacterium ATCC 29904]|nr:hypothetical protein DR73_4459 [Enterobacteriaceae bacterium ATCC 29904]